MGCFPSQNLFNISSFISLLKSFKGIVQTFSLKKRWFYENFVPGPQILRGVSFFKAFMIFRKKIILNHFGNQFWGVRNRNFENQLIWNFCSGNTGKIELRTIFFYRNIKILIYCIIVFIFGTVATFSTRILGTDFSINFCSGENHVFYIGIVFWQAFPDFSWTSQVPTPW